MDHFPTNWGRPRNDAIDAYGTYPIPNRPNNVPKDAFSEGIQRTQQPIVTGTSVLAIKYKDGIMMAADNLGEHTPIPESYRVSYRLASYGSLARFKDIQRLQPVGAHTVIGAGGDMSDFQYIQGLLDELIIEEFTAQDGHHYGPAEIHSYLSRIMYSRRSKMNPLWNAILVGGIKDNKSFLSFVDLLGTTYSASTLATGYGAHIAQPLLRKAVEGREDILTEEEAAKILEDSMRVLFYRDARSIDKVQAFFSVHIQWLTESSIKWRRSQQKVSQFRNQSVLKPLGHLQRASEGTELKLNKLTDSLLYTVPKLRFFLMLRPKSNPALIEIRLSEVHLLFSTKFLKIYACSFSNDLRSSRMMHPSTLCTSWGRPNC
ncbi:hypothetical protein H0H93_006987 [Arthromyces matolae]|nr:hypothetical protein H0H93_006987 [Arthromyces matolae]